MSDTLRDAYDVVVIGAGAAGLNGALLLARSRRSVAVIDAGMPRNAPAAGVHGLLGTTGRRPRSSSHGDAARSAATAVTSRPARSRR